MSEYTRREFLGVGALLTTGFGVGDWKLAAGEDRVFGSQLVARRVSSEQ